jgi:hypothetical protein
MRYPSDGTGPQEPPRSPAVEPPCCAHPGCHHAWREVCADCGRHVCWSHTYWLGEGAMRLPFCASSYEAYGHIAE